MKVVVYTPTEDFFYNTMAGASFVVILLASLVSIIVGYMVTASLTKGNRSSIWAKVAGVAAALGTLALIRAATLF